MICSLKNQSTDQIINHSTVGADWVKHVQTSKQQSDETTLHWTISNIYGIGPQSKVERKKNEIELKIGIKTVTKMYIDINILWYKGTENSGIRGYNSPRNEIRSVSL